MDKRHYFNAEVAAIEIGDRLPAGAKIRRRVAPWDALIERAASNVGVWYRATRSYANVGSGVSTARTAVERNGLNLNALQVAYEDAEDGRTYLYYRFSSDPRPQERFPTRDS